MDPVKRIDVLILGDRNYPMAQVKIPEHLCFDLKQLVEAGQILNASIGEEEITRAIWRLGSRQLRRNLARGILPSASDLAPEKAANGSERASDSGVQEGTSFRSGSGAGVDQRVGPNGGHSDDDSGGRSAGSTGNEPAPVPDANSEGTAENQSDSGSGA